MSDREFLRYPDLAGRALGGAVVYANDESFAERENLIKPAPAVHDPTEFGHKGKVYDGWETRRRRTPGHDWAIVRLGVPGVVHGVIVDTAFFRGNYPPEISVEAAGFDGYPTPEQLNTAQWATIVPRAFVEGHAATPFTVDDPRRYTHVRLSMYPDGGIARFRVHGEAVTDPRLLVTGGLDLASLENGGLVTACSNQFYGSPNQLISPGLAKAMADGWENARRRDGGNDFVEFALAGSGRVQLLELDTSYFLFNAPGAAKVTGVDETSADPADPGSWFTLLERTDLSPDTRHRFAVHDAPPATRLRLDVYPDGGLARFHAIGQLSTEGADALWLRWFNTLPDAQLLVALTGMGATEDTIERLRAIRPAATLADLPVEVVALLG
ncbi:allantoicase [Nocardiopsis ansamitocini]|uniref:Probable allantoicase n=1 Tax=Nocardiopsis ansamitocini TaxID=1670832 RepID=A0A9W6P3E4_9ACTN|nr:allantoicase [Nocardiopsis ansamitocini]GLU46357.1 putative allantoicase [Nocardiopsis ansamitocini]